MEIYGIDRMALNRWLNIKQSRQDRRADEEIAKRGAGAEKNGD